MKTKHLTITGDCGPYEILVLISNIVSIDRFSMDQLFEDAQMTKPKRKLIWSGATVFSEFDME